MALDRGGVRPLVGVVHESKPGVSVPCGQAKPTRIDWRSEWMGRQRPTPAWRTRPGESRRGSRETDSRSGSRRRSGAACWASEAYAPLSPKAPGERLVRALDHCPAQCLDCLLDEAGMRAVSPTAPGSFIAPSESLRPAASRPALARRPGRGGPMSVHRPDAALLPASRAISERSASSPLRNSKVPWRESILLA